MQIHARRGGGIGHQRLMMEEQDHSGPLPELIANRPLVHDVVCLFHERRGKGGSVGRRRTPHGLTPLATAALMSMPSPRSLRPNPSVGNLTVIYETDHLEQRRPVALLNDREAETLVV
jgi:hypothetical protein